MRKPGVIWRAFRMVLKKAWREPTGTLTLHDRNTNHEIHRIEIPSPAKAFKYSWKLLQLAVVIKLIALLIYYLWHL